MSRANNVANHSCVNWRPKGHSLSFQPQVPRDQIRKRTFTVFATMFETNELPSEHDIDHHCSPFDPEDFHLAQSLVQSLFL